MPDVVPTRRRSGRQEARAGNPARLALVVLFVGLVAGRFGLGGLVPGFPSLDVRVLATVAAGLSLVPLAGRPPVRYAPAARGLATALVALFAWLALSAVWAPWGAELAPPLLDLSFLAAFVVMTAIVTTHLAVADLRWLWGVVVVIAAVYLAAAVGAGPGVQGRYSAFGGGPNVFVRVMGLGAVGVLYAYLRSRSLWLLLGLPPFVVGALLSGSRGGMLAGLVIAVVGVVPVMRRIGPNRTGQVLVTLGLACVPVGVLFGPRLGPLIEKRLVEQTVEQGYSSGRDVVSAIGLEIFAQHPVAGVGLGGVSLLLRETVGLSHTHNLVIETASTGGAVALVLLLVVLSRIVVGLRRLDRLEPGVLCTALAALLVFVSALFSGDLYDSRLIWFFALLTLGLGVGPTLPSRASRGLPHARLVVGAESAVDAGESVVRRARPADTVSGPRPS